MTTHLRMRVAAVLTLLLVMVIGGAPTPSVQATEPEVPILRVAADIKADNMRKVFEIGSEIGHPETLQAILLQESNGGLAKQGHKSYGLMQVQVVAARSILTRVPELRTQYYGDRPISDISYAELVYLLMHNDEANIRIAAHHFKLYFRLVGQDWDKAVAAYNAGIGGVRKIQNPAEFRYVVEIRDKLQRVVRPFNHKQQLR